MNVKIYYYSMTTTVEMKYTLDDFNTINSKISADDYINEDILKYIQELTSQVGSPNYSKTPVFSNVQKKNRKKRKNQEVRTMIGRLFVNFKQLTFRVNMRELKKTLMIQELCLIN